MHVCYKTIRINYPLFSEPNYDNIEAKTFLHLTQDKKRLFFFGEFKNKDQAKKIGLYFLDE